MHDRSATRWRRPATTSAAIVAALALTVACSGSPQEGTESGPDASDVDASAEVSITTAGLAPTERAEERALYLDRVERFEAQYPNIDLEPTEFSYDPATFNAQLEGGTLPDTFTVPFTEIQGLIERGQVADITDFAIENEVISGLNENVLQVGRDAEGKLYGVPIAAYTMGLLYNRELFEEAGLDPDAPPTTWEEVAEAAEAIENATDASGFGIMTLENAGGWTLSALSYAFGGLMQDEVDGSTQAVFADTGATAEALEWIQDVRWNRDAWTDDTLLSGDDARNAFAGGNLGMWIGGADIYDDVVGNRGMDPDDVGIAPMPQSQDGLGALGGGSISVASPLAEANQVAAALRWIEFGDLSKFTDEDAAVADAQARQNDEFPVGAPRLPLTGQEQEAQYQEWIAPYVDVPQDHFTAYQESTTSLPIVLEPAVQAQALYAALDAVVQEVLTTQDTDIQGLLDSAQEQFNAQITVE